MDKILKDIADVEHVRGCLFITNDGAIAHAHFLAPPDTAPETRAWPQLVSSLGGLLEVDILFDDARLYIRKTNKGYLLIILEVYAVLSMIKLQCNVLVAKIDSYKPKGISRFFKK